MSETDPSWIALILQTIAVVGILAAVLGVLLMAVVLMVAWLRCFTDEPQVPYGKAALRAVAILFLSEFLFGARHGRRPFGGWSAGTYLAALVMGGLAGVYLEWLTRRISHWLESRRRLSAPALHDNPE